MIIERGKMKDGNEYILVNPESLIEELKNLKENGYNYLVLMSAVDYLKYREVVYHLSSYNEEKMVVVKVRTSDDVLPSATVLWDSANWFEREIYDLMGIKFNGHPDLKRIFLPEGWVGHPLRKDYDISKEQFVNMNDDGTDRVSFDPKDGW
ncbi:MAG: NADH-quinone oxidoreductase subunit C [Thermoplasmata archaeon]|jgi:NADH (or F420H2) dehydrogenase, subunit C|nr:NADH-quinone oxidoreductase subunit C [Thermoplasmata archaeon]MVT13326.1 NADH-quinone oxidoreductase subunit C [Euryarchaeota archaeon]MVT14378.1 NADH-quinone oxidoreductase subunit C [Euryarchaeota archaeon]MVT35332.1 NADH-quinone oxidoreductase subunit C [Euryarchaeota archaeon]